MYFLGIDIGTFSSKGVLVGEDGRLKARASVAHTMDNPAPGYFEQDAEQIWWGDFCKLSRELIQTSDISPEEIGAVGASTLGADCLPVDEEGKPLRKAILYGIDARCTEEMEEMTSYYGEERVQELFGRPICSGDVAAKILWLKKNEPEVYKKACKFLTGSSYVTAKLTGNYTVDRFLGIASFRPFYQMDGTIREEMCDPICSPSQLAEGHAVTDIAGRVTEAAAAETGLAPGTPVIVGTGDSAAEAISTGVLSPGDLMVQFGSSLFFYCCTDRMVTDERVRGNSFVIPGRYSIAAGTNNAGTLQNWYRDTLFSDCLQAEETEAGSSFAQMMEGIEEIEPGSEGLVTLPYFAGERTPINDPAARGMVFGLTLNHTRKHLYRSALEGIVFSILQHIEIFREKGIEPTRILAAGGGTKNPVWMQMTADITGIPVAVGEETAGACYGDALMAAIGVGHFKGFEELRDIINIKRIYTPDENRTKLYRPYYELFCRLYEDNKDSLHRLSDLNHGV